MKKITFLLGTAVTIFVAGCAKSPESIGPSYVSPLVYSGLNCSQLSDEMARVEMALSQASEQQRNARTNDTVGVILLGLPVSSLSGGNVADQVARLKGEKQTLQQSASKGDCKIQIAQDPQATEKMADDLNAVETASGKPKANAGLND